MAQSNLNIVIDAQNRMGSAVAQAKTQMQGLQNSMRNVGRRMQSIGTKMTAGLTVPIAGAGAAATKFAADFQQNLKQTRAQTGLTEEAIGRVGDATERIAVQTGQATDKIFEAQRLAQSSTLDLAEANQLVETAAKGAASGLGSMKTIVNLGTTVAQKFGDSVNSAKAGIEVMAAAAEDSQTSVNKFAEGLLKGSAQMDILNLSMQEGSTIFSRLSDAAANAKVAGTQFRAMLKSVQKPSNKMSSLMGDVFGSVENFRSELEKNAIDAMFKLKDAAKENGKTLSAYTKNVRAAAGMSNFFASSQETVNATLEKATNSSGKLTEMFRESESITRLFNQALQAGKKALRSVGDEIIDILAPVIAGFIEKANNFSDWFEGLSSSTQKGILAVAGFVAALGPLIALLGTLSIALSAISLPAVAFTAAFAAIAAIAFKVAQSWDTVKAKAQQLWSQLADTTIFQTLVTNLKLLWKNITQRLVPALRELWQKHGAAVKRLFKFLGKLFGGALLIAINGVVAGLNLLVAALTGLIEWLTKTKTFIEETVKPAFKNFGDTIIKAIVDPVGTAIDQFEKLTEAVSDALDKVRDYFAEVGSGGDSTLGNIADSVGGFLPDAFDVTSVNDAVITPSGDVVETSPQDFLFATQNPNELAGGGGQKVQVNITGGTFMGTDSTEVAEHIGDKIIRRLKDNRRGV